MSEPPEVERRPVDRVGVDLPCDSGIAFVQQRPGLIAVELELNFQVDQIR